MTSLIPFCLDLHWLIMTPQERDDRTFMNLLLPIHNKNNKVISKIIRCLWKVMKA